MLLRVVRSGAKLERGGGVRAAVLVLLCPAVIGLACRSSADRSPQSSAEPDELAHSLIAQVEGPRVRLVFLVSNAASDPVALTFPTGQEFDFSVFRNGRRLWSWSQDKMFTQAIHEVTLTSGETRRYETTWETGPVTAGVYRVSAQLTSASHPLEAHAEFELP